jgi:hypothetical protein
MLVLTSRAVQRFDGLATGLNRLPWQGKSAVSSHSTTALCPAFEAPAVVSNPLGKGQALPPGGDGR